jgi:general secretion pathway protein D
MGGVISVRGTSAQHRQVQAYIDDVTESAKRQVLVEVTVVEVELSDQYQAGVDWARVASNGGLGEDGVSIINDMTGGNLAAAPVFTMTYNNFDADGSGFSTTVRLLEQFGDTKVLSTPRILALNNQTALLKVVDERVYFTLTSETVEATDSSPPRTIITSEVNTVPVGFVMSVTPQINANGNVSLNVRPTLTRILGFVIDPAPRLQNVDFDNLVPELHVSEIESLLEVADGQTVVIGGLMQDRQSKQRDGVPYLSRIPLVGDLFSYRNDEVVKSELVLFLRPTVIRGAGVGDEAIAQARP